MTPYILAALGFILGVLAYRTIGWCRLERPMVEAWHALIESPDEPCMPPRRTVQRF